MMSNIKLFVPILLVICVVLGSQIFQTTQVVNEMNLLKQAKDQQEKSLISIQKLQKQVNALAFGTLRLAEKGNVNAIEVIEKFKKAGIEIKAPPSAPPPTKN